MKNLLILSCFLFVLNMAAQDHFSGINTSKRIGILNAGINPAELSNLNSKYEINVFSASINASNNKVGFEDLINSNNIEDLIFTGSDPVNMRIDSEIYGPGFAMKVNKWAFAFTTKAYAKLSVIDVDPQLGQAINNGTLNTFLTSTSLNNDYNQRINGTTYGEVGFSIARNLYNNEKHKFNTGITLKLLFPGSYANFGADKFKGEIRTFGGDAFLNNADAKVNFAYSGSLANDFTNSNDYLQSLFGPLNGVAADIGFNYQLKDSTGYKLNAGVSIRNIGGMTFKDNNNQSTNYTLRIESTFDKPNGLNLNQFQNVTNFKEVETILLNEGYLTKLEGNKNFKVSLPTVFTAYADIKVVSKFFVAVYTQQKLKNDKQNDQITTQNVFSVTPRIYFKNYELFSSWAANEISGTTGGFGFRIYGFYLGSSSIVTALINNSKQADVFIGYRVGLR